MSEKLAWIENGHLVINVREIETRSLEAALTVDNLVSAEPHDPATCKLAEHGKPWGHTEHSLCCVPTHAYQSVIRLAAALLLDCSRGVFGQGGGMGSPIRWDVAMVRFGEAIEEWGIPGDERPEPKGKSDRKAISDGLRRAVWDRDEWSCVHCGDHRNLTIDHKIAVVNGGTNDFDNLQTLCGSCNSSKRDRAEVGPNRRKAVKP